MPLFSRNHLINNNSINGPLETKVPAYEEAASLFFPNNP
jgi:hypothetical protein